MISVCDLHPSNGHVTYLWTFCAPRHMQVSFWPFYYRPIGTQGLVHSLVGFSRAGVSVRVRMESRLGMPLRPFRYERSIYKDFLRHKQPLIEQHRYLLSTALW